MFNVPKISRQIHKSHETPRELTDEQIQISRPKNSQAKSSELPGTIKMGGKRQGLFKRLMERGRIQKSVSTFSQLQQKKFFPDLVHTEVDCLDEAELRGRFPSQGTSHKFFMSGDYKFAFVIPSDSDSVVVAQILWSGKVRISPDLVGL